MVRQVWKGEAMTNYRPQNPSVLYLILEAMGIEPDVDTNDGRKVIQKAVYLAQAAGVPLGYSYRWYDA